MKGIIFTEFIEMVENKFGFEMADRVIQDSNLSFKGHYTAVGTYDHREIVKLVNSLSLQLHIPTDELFTLYGQYLFRILVSNYAHFVEEGDNALTFLERVESYIHPEVLKIYPEAELPRFETKREQDRMIMTYYSPRALGYLARGIIQGCLVHFGESADVAMELLNEEGTIVKFIIIK